MLFIGSFGSVYDFLEIDYQFTNRVDLNQQISNALSLFKERLYKNLLNYLSNNKIAWTLEK